MNAFYELFMNALSRFRLSSPITNCLSGNYIIKVLERPGSRDQPRVPVEGNRKQRNEKLLGSPPWWSPGSECRAQRGERTLPLGGRAVLKCTRPGPGKLHTVAGAT